MGKLKDFLLISLTIFSVIGIICLGMTFVFWDWQLFWIRMWIALSIILCIVIGLPAALSAKEEKKPRGNQ